MRVNQARAAARELNAGATSEFTDPHGSNARVGIAVTLDKSQELQALGRQISSNRDFEDVRRKDLRTLERASHHLFAHYVFEMVHGDDPLDAFAPGVLQHRVYA